MLKLVVARALGIGLLIPLLVVLWGSSGLFLASGGGFRVLAIQRSSLGLTAMGNYAGYGPAVERAAAVLLAEDTATPTPSSLTADLEQGVTQEGNLSVANGGLALAPKGPLGAWSAATSMNGRRLFAAAVIAHGHIYIIGGWDGTPGIQRYTANVEYASINANGSLGDWANTSSMNNARGFHAAVVWGNYLYAIGGETTGGATLSSVERAAINPDGTLGPWEALAPLAPGRSGLSAVATSSHIYIMGGRANGGYLSSVERATIRPDGTLDSWEPVGAMLAPRAYAAAVATANHIYVIGGLNSASGYLSSVERAPIGLDGGLGSWGTVALLTGRRAYHGAAIASGYVYALGGWYGQYLRSVERAAIQEDGTLGPWMTSSELGVGRRSPAVAAHNGHIYVLGGESSGSYLNSVERVATIPDGTPGQWEEISEMDTPRHNAAFVVAKGYIYALGGYNDQWVPLDTVERAAINPDGSLGGWAPTTAMSKPRAGLAVVATEGYLYAIGGYDGTSFLNNVERAAILEDGSLDTWTSVTSLPQPLSDHSAVVASGYIFIIGGRNQSGIGTGVVRAPINSDGSLGSWSTVATMPTPRYDHAALVVGDQLYIIGGYSGIMYYDTVLRALVDEDGTLGSWATEANTMGRERKGLGAAAMAGYLYAVGGDGISASTMEYAAIGTDGSLGPWSALVPLSNRRTDLGVFAGYGYLYLLGGRDGVVWSSVERTRLYIHDGLGRWHADSPLATPRRGVAGALARGYLYAIGGYDGSGVALASIERAAVGNDGTLSAWELLTTTLNTARAFSAVAATRDYLYILGGSSGSSYFRTVEKAPIQPDGTLGSWSTTTPMTIFREAGAAAIVDRYIFAIGGFDDSQSYVTSVETATIQTGGDLGSWFQITPLHTPRAHHAVAQADGYIYVIGGHNASGFLTSIEYGLVNADGGVDLWQFATSLISTRAGAAAVVVNGYLYVLGGHNGTSYLNTVERAFIKADGSLGAWAEVSFLPAARSDLAALSSAGHIYAIGGETTGGTTLSSVERSRSKDRLSATGSFHGLFDLGYDNSLVSLEWVAAIHDGDIQVRYRTAGAADSSYSDWSPYTASSSLTNTVVLSGTARYLEYQFLFSRTSSGNIAVASQVSQVTLRYLQLLAPTPTATRTATTTPTATSTPTPTYTPTATVVHRIYLPIIARGWSLPGSPPTSTATPTPMPTATATSMSTATPTSTSMPMPTATPTPMPTATSTPLSANVRIDYVEYDPPGDEVQGEYVDIRTYGAIAISMQGWQLKDLVNTTYTFPNNFILGAASSVRVWTKVGTNTTTDLYWGRGSAVWNNDSDTAYLYDNNSQLVDQRSWSLPGPTASSTATHTPTPTPTTTPTPTPTATSTPLSANVRIDHVEYDPPGDDVEGEYVDIRNFGAIATSMQGWQLKDLANNTYTFPGNFILGAASSVRVWTKAGTNTTTDLYWGRGSAVWNNDHDTAYLYDSNSHLVDQYSW